MNEPAGHGAVPGGDADERQGAESVGQHDPTAWLISWLLCRAHQIRPSTILNLLSCSQFQRERGQG